MAGFIELPSRQPGGTGGRRAAAAPTAADVQQVRIARDPGVRASPEAFGAGTGQALQQFGESISRTADQFAAISDDLATKKRRSQVNASTAEAANELQLFADDLERDPDYETYADRFEKHAQTVREKYSQGLDQQGIEDFSQRFTLYKLESARRVRRLGTARAVDAGVADLSTALDGYAHLAGRTDSPEEFDLAQAMARESIDRAVQDGFINAAQGEKDFGDFLATTDEVQALGAIAENPGKAAELLADHEIFPNLDEKRRLGLLKEAKTQARIEKAERDREVKERRAILRGKVSNALKDEISSIRRTGKAQGLVTEDSIRAAYEPDDADTILRQMQEEKDFYAVRQSVALSPLSEDAATLAGAAPEGEGFAVEAERQDLLLKAVQEKRKALGDDPAGYIFQASPAIAAEFQAAETPEDMRAAITTMLDEQERIGLPGYARRALSNGQAGQLVADYGGQPDGQGRADWIRAQAEAYEEHWPQVYREMVDAGLPGGAIVLAGMTGPGQTRAATMLAEAQQEGTKALREAVGKETAGDIEDAVAAELQAFDTTMANTPGGGGIASLYRDQVTALAFSYARQGGDPATVASQAANDVVNSQYTFHGTYRVPHQYDGDLAETRLDAYRRFGLSQLDLDLPFEPGLEPDEVKRQYLDHLGTYGYWITNADETGVLLFDGVGRTVTRQNGDPVEILFGEIDALPDLSVPPAVMEGASP